MPDRPPAPSPLRRLAMRAALLAAVPAAARAAPTTRPATRPAPADVVTLGDDVVHFPAPPAADWTLQKGPEASPDAVLFRHGDGDVIEVQLAPADFQIAPDTAGQFAAAIVKSLRQAHAKAGDPLTAGPRVVRDRRFDIDIAETFTHAGVTVAEVHLYRSVGPRTVMVTAISTSPDPAVAAATFRAAGDAMAGAKSPRRATRKPHHGPAKRPPAAGGPATPG